MDSLATLDKKYLGPILFALTYVIAFATYYFSKGDWEFLWYIVVLVFFLVLIIGTIKYTKLSLISVWGLCIWGLLHMIGGGVVFSGDVLYAWKILPVYDAGGEFFILKFDQVVHTFGFAVATLVMYEIISSRWKNGGRFLIFVAILSGMGLGVINEIAEFIAVLAFPETGVGGYYNTLLDLVFNTVGAGLVGIFLYLKNK